MGDPAHGVIGNAFLKGYGVLKKKSKKRVSKLSHENYFFTERLVQDVLVARVLLC